MNAADIASAAASAAAVVVLTGLMALPPVGLLRASLRGRLSWRTCRQHWENSAMRWDLPLAVSIHYSA